jgi:hypothetical protein
MHIKSLRTVLFAFYDYWKTSPLQNYEKSGNVNFRFFIKTQYRLGIQTIEIFYELKTIYNDQAPSYATVAR